MSKFSTWLKAHLRELFFVLIILLVSSLSFASGYLLAQKEGRAPIIIQTGNTAQ